MITCFITQISYKKVVKAKPSYALPGLKYQQLYSFNSMNGKDTRGYPYRGYPPPVG